MGSSRDDDPDKTEYKNIKFMFEFLAPLYRHLINIFRKKKPKPQTDSTVLCVSWKAATLLRGARAGGCWCRHRRRRRRQDNGSLQVSAIVGQRQAEPTII